MSNDAVERAAVARRAAAAGADVALESFRTGLDVETKANKTDYVTRADRDAQVEVVDVIEAAYPDEPVVGEEDGVPSALPESGRAWIVDPIDGSHNYVRGMPTWVTSVAAVEDGEPVAAATVFPTVDDTYVAGPDGTRRNGEPVTVSDLTDPERCTVVPTVWWPMDRREEFARATGGIVRRFGDLRRLGSVQAVLAELAAGGVDGALTNVVANPWDTVAGVHLVRSAGGTVTDLEGAPWRYDSAGLVASNGAIHEEVLAVARSIDDR